MFSDAASTAMAMTYPLGSPMKYSHLAKFPELYPIEQPNFLNLLFLLSLAAMEILAFLTPLGVDHSLFHASGNQNEQKIHSISHGLHGITLCILGENSHKFSLSIFSHLMVSSFEYSPTCTFQLLPGRVV